MYMSKLHTFILLRRTPGVSAADLRGAVSPKPGAADYVPPCKDTYVQTFNRVHCSAILIWSTCADTSLELHSETAPNRKTVKKRCGKRCAIFNESKPR
jgi:hypothetical protein